MALYTERNGMRAPVERTSIITKEMYALLFDCCFRYHDNLGWKYPAQCPDGNGICGMDLDQFNNNMRFEIPTLFRDSRDQIGVPGRSYYDYDPIEYDQYALLDYIEFFGQNCRDISSRYWHSFHKHNDLEYANTNKVCATFRDEINTIFQKTGLLYTLTETMIVERVLEDGVLTTEVATVIKTVKEQGLKALLVEAISLFKQPNPAARSNAVEKLWDAFERMKTYYTALDKKASAAKVVEDMGQGYEPFKQLFNNEFAALTKIGNDFRIRHHETDKIDIQDIRYYDYFFNRCLSLISTALQYLQ